MRAPQIFFVDLAMRLTTVQISGAMISLHFVEPRAYDMQVSDNRRVSISQNLRWCCEKLCWRGQFVEAERGRMHAQRSLHSYQMV